MHPNTIGLFEKIELISPPQRQKNGYRVFTTLHINQLKILKAALYVEILQNGLRKEAIAVIYHLLKPSDNLDEPNLSF